MRPVDKVLQRLDGVKKSGNSWSALCPAHEDRNPSLSISEGDDGRVLLKCHVGCSCPDILAAIGLEERDLFPRAGPSAEPRQRPEVRLFTSADAEERLADSVRRNNGATFELAHRFDYRTVDSGWLRVLRFENGVGKKAIRQMSSTDGSNWALRVPSSRILPYHHERLGDAQRVVVVEGETCVEALESLGLVATTSAGGSNAAKKTDWSNLADKDVILMPDNDDAGRKYIEDVQLLCAARTFGVVELPGLGAGEDVVDFAASRRSQGRSEEALRSEIEALIAAVEPIEAAPRPLARETFPVEALPPDVLAFVRAISESRSIDLSAVCATALVAMGTAIGLSRVAWDDHACWEEVPVFWLAFVSRTGTRKSTLINDLFEPHMSRQAELANKHEQKLAEYNLRLGAWKRRKGDSDSSEFDPPPIEPKLEHVYSSDATSEKLIEILRCSPRGIVQIHDELTSFFGGLGRYSGNADSERALYLSLFRGVQLKKDRCGTGTQIVEKAASSIVGGVQPDVLARCFDQEAFASGLASRFLLVYPGAQVKQYQQGPTEDVRAAYGRFMSRLFNLQMESDSEVNGRSSGRPRRIGFSNDARRLLADFVPDWSAESLTSSREVEAAMSKLEGYALRFALVIRAGREVQEACDTDEPISRRDLELGIGLARWFRDEAVRVYGELAADTTRAPRHALLNRVAVIRESFAGVVTVREWHKRNTRRTTGQAKAELDELVSAGLAAWRPRPSGKRGGRPTEECALLDVADDPKGVSGCGLRGATPPRDVTNPVQSPSEGDGDANAGFSRNPKPLEGVPVGDGDDRPHAGDPTPSPSSHKMSEASAEAVACRISGDRSEHQELLIETREDENGNGSAGRPAPRNPQPETPSRGIKEGNGPVSCESAHPRTPQDQPDDGRATTQVIAQRPEENLLPERLSTESASPTCDWEEI